MLLRYIITAFLLNILMMTTAQAAIEAELNIETKINDDSSEIVYTLKSGSQDLTNVWLTLSLNALNQNEADNSPNMSCKLKLNSKLLQGYDYAVNDGQHLRLYFETIPANSLLEFGTIWETEIKPQEARLMLVSNEVSTSSNWSKYQFYKLLGSKPVSIAFLNENSCASS